MKVQYPRNYKAIFGYRGKDSPRHLVALRKSVEDYRSKITTDTQTLEEELWNFGFKTRAGLKITEEEEDNNDEDNNSINNNEDALDKETEAYNDDGISIQNNHDNNHKHLRTSTDSTINSKTIRNDSLPCSAGKNNGPYYFSCRPGWRVLHPRKTSPPLSSYYYYRKVVY